MVIRVFVSYAHGQPEHMEEVRWLVEQLAAYRELDVHWDREVNGDPDEGWTLWMQRQLSEAQRVLVICDAAYLERYRRDVTPDEGRGVGWEGISIRQWLIENQGANDKYRPVLLSDGAREHVPEELRAFGPFTPIKGIEPLQRWLTDQPEWRRPPAKAALDLPPLPPAAAPTQPADPPQPAPQPTNASPTGWQEITAEHLGQQKPLSDRARRRYFDGAWPKWRHAVDPALPRRQLVHLLRGALLERAEDGEPSATVLLGAVGEGKTTALLQTAADLIRDHGWRALWRPEPGMTLEPTAVAQLEGGPWLVLFDDGEDLLAEIDAICRLLDLTGRDDIFLLGAARDSDWQHAQRRARRRKAPTGSGTDRLPVQPLTLSGLDHEDAAAIAGAWIAAGSLPGADAEDVAGKLVAAADGPRESLLGAVLELRHGPDGLVRHVAKLLDSLAAAHLDGGPDLERVLLTLAAADVAEFGGVHRATLAELTGLPLDRAWADLVMPLGDEAAAAVSDGNAHCRHPKVAEAVVKAAHSGGRVDLAVVYGDLVRAVVAAARQHMRLGPSHGRTLHGAKHLPQRLPLPAEERARIAVATAEATVRCQHRVDALVDLADTLVAVGRVDAAREVFRQNVDGLPDRSDYGQFGRGYWFAWGVAEGQVSPTAEAHPVASLLLALCSVSDFLNPLSIDNQQAKTSLAGIGRALQLARKLSDDLRGLGLRSTADLGQRTRLDSRTRGFFKSHARDAARLGAKRSVSLSAAIDELARLYAEARPMLDDPALADHLPAEVGFEALAAHLRIKRRR